MTTITQFLYLMNLSELMGSFRQHIHKKSRILVPILKKNCLFLLLILGSFSSYGQDLILDTQAGIPVRSADANSNFVKNLVKQRSTTKIQRPFQFVKHAIREKGEVYLDLNSRVVKDLLRKKEAYLSLAIPVDNTHEIGLELYQTDILSPDFKVTTSSGKEYEMHSRSVFYQGIVKNHPASWVAASLIDDELIILINDDRGKYTLAKVKGQDNYVLYNEMTKGVDYSFDCGTADLETDISLPKLQASASTSRNQMNCPVYVYIEVDNESYI